MSTTTVLDAVRITRQPHHGRRPERLWLIGASFFLAAFIAYASFIALNWPFKKQPVIDVLQEASLRTVTIGHFRKTFFPPGCVAQDVRFERHENKNKPPIIQIDTLTLQGSYLGLITAQDRLSLVKMVHMHVTVPPAEVHGKPDPLMPLNHTNSSVKTLRIDKIVADGAVLDFFREGSSQPYRITIDKLAAYDVRNNSAISYKTILTNALPPGKIHSTGVFGPWQPNHPEETPVGGSYTVQDMNLAAFKELSGTVQAQGSLDGKLGELITKGTVNVAKFHVVDTGHTRDITATYQARVDGRNGDTTLDDVQADFDHSSLQVNGTITSEKDRKGRKISLDLFCGKGRIEDVLDLFIGAKQSPMLGAMTMKAHVDVPPGEGTLLKRMRMSGDFGVDDGRFTNKATQADLNRLSDSADKKNEADDQIALSELKGHGDIRNGVATLTNLSFAMQGATARMTGTYSLLNYDIDLHGHLYTDGKPWTATTGMKSWMMRVITPFLKKKKSVRVVPFNITGNYQKTSVGLDF